MVRVLLGAFIVAHGLLTAFIWLSPPKADAPFRATHSWLIGDARPLAVVVALMAAAGFVLAGVGVIADQAWWAFTGIGAGVGGAPVDDPVLQPLAAGRHRHQRRDPLRRVPSPAAGIAARPPPRRTP